MTSMRETSSGLGAFWERLSKSRWFDVLAAGFIAASVAMFLVPNLDAQGIGRDEAMYMVAGETYVHWFEGARSWKQRTEKKWIDRHFGYNHEHPPLAKELFGLSWRMFHRCSATTQSGAHWLGRRPYRVRRRHHTFGLLSEIAAFRLPSALLVALAAGILYLLGSSVFGRLAGLLGALFFVTMPRVFFHARISGLDGPVTAFMVLAVYGYWRALKSRWWALGAGLLFGLAAAAKLNALFLPLLFAFHYAWSSRDEFRSRGAAWWGLGLVAPTVLLSAYFGATTDHRWVLAGVVLGLAVIVGLRRDVTRHPLRALGLTIPALFWAQLLLGALVVFALWPYLWHSPWKRFWWYLTYHLHHVNYNTEYFGINYNLPPFPWSFPFVMTLATVPAVVVLLFIAGSALALARFMGRWSFLVGSHRGLASSNRGGPGSLATGSEGDSRDNGRAGFWKPRAGRDASGWFLVALMAYFPMVLIALPSTPIFGGTRTWMPAMPFIALLAGWATQELLSSVGEILDWTGGRKAALSLVFAALVLAPGVAQTLHAGRLAPSSYGPIVGGVQGAADSGFKRQYWGYSTREVLGELNRQAPKNARVYWHDTIGWARDFYVRGGLLRKDIRSSGTEYWGVARSNIALFLYEKHQVMWEYVIWQEYGTFQPFDVFTLDGVPLVTMYRRTGAPRLEPALWDRPK